MSHNMEYGFIYWILKYQSMYYSMNLGVEYVYIHSYKWSTYGTLRLKGKLEHLSLYICYVVCICILNLFIVNLVLFVFFLLFYRTRSYESSDGRMLAIYIILDSFLRSTVFLLNIYLIELAKISTLFDLFKLLKWCYMI